MSGLNQIPAKNPLPKEAPWFESRLIRQTVATAQKNRRLKSGTTPEGFVSGPRKRGAGESRQGEHRVGAPLNAKSSTGHPAVFRVRHT